MPSERALKRAANIGHIDPLTGTKHIVSESVAEALDSEWIAGMEEAAKIAEAHLDHGEFLHGGRHECVDALVAEIRAQIEAEKKGAGL